jgi:hypothetical protein
MALYAAWRLLFAEVGPLESVLVAQTFTARSRVV